MRNIAFLLVLGLSVSPIMAVAQSSARHEDTPQSRSCWARADQRGLHGEERRKFHATCVTGAMAPDQPTRPAKTAEAAAVTSPSGVNPAVRSRQCNDRANALGLKESAFQEFRKSCLASASPVSTIGSGTMKQKPSVANDSFGNITTSTPH
jgi:hypothetical protein